MPVVLNTKEIQTKAGRLLRFLELRGFNVCRSPDLMYMRANPDGNGDPPWRTFHGFGMLIAAVHNKLPGTSLVGVGDSLQQAWVSLERSVEASQWGSAWSAFREE